MIRDQVLEWSERFLLALLIGIGLLTVILGIQAIGRPDPTPATPTAVTPPRFTPIALIPTWTPRPTDQPPAVAPPKIGVIAGHWQYDSGAVCDDGLTEVEINLNVARQTAALLASAGYEVEVLPEFSEHLQGYRADALVSIHADSCNIPEASGFKVAHVSRSAIPEQEDQLVECIRDAYARTTGLAFHANSITYDMTEYHVFYEIAPETPAAIIETGFMSGDRELLTQHPDLVALGIAEGIRCFVGPPTP